MVFVKRRAIILTSSFVNEKSIIYTIGFVFEIYLFVACRFINSYRPLLFLLLLYYIKKDLAEVSPRAKLKRHPKYHNRC